LQDPPQLELASIEKFAEGSLLSLAQATAMDGIAALLIPTAITEGISVAGSGAY